MSGTDMARSRTLGHGRRGHVRARKMDMSCHLLQSAPYEGRRPLGAMSGAWHRPCPERTWPGKRKTPPGLAGSFRGREVAPGSAEGELGGDGRVVVGERGLELAAHAGEDLGD